MAAAALVAAVVPVVPAEAVVAVIVATVAVAVAVAAKSQRGVDKYAVLNVSNGCGRNRYLRRRLVPDCHANTRIQRRGGR